MQYTLKKSLGQHFLKDENVCKQIVAALQQTSFKNLVEVGPGAGALTKYLLDIKDINFKAVELDDEKVVFLKTTYPVLTDKIIHQDFLHTTPPFADEFIVIGNFPYNISTQILFKVLDWQQQVPVVIGMFQKEVAERVAANYGNKSYGIISVLIQAFYNVEYLFDVAPTCFTPPPKVMSGVIRLTRKDEPLKVASEKKFTLLVKTAFNQRRKMLRNPLKQLFEADVLQQDIFTKRAEQLSIQDFADLSFKMK
ncbi:MAG: 16S rRNA (adenine(1518)-N(6)/adenine(1519)-N(6))-dimethyltransferase RsmA [Bacteroidetes bacterium]|nr:16S rRNA (adenine(1518)-N(6)/adenine(1519)-N(6))-dimethyltransferase RsmA [Bacteroidota bacterium]